MGPKLLVAGYVSSLVFICVSLGAIFFSNKFIDSYILSSINLDPSNKIFNGWLQPSTPVYLNVYVFNLKNREDFEKNGAKPIVEQIGPFVYRRLVSREELVENMNYTLTYKQRRRYFFEREMSVQDENYQVTTLNMAALNVISQIKYKCSMEHELVNKAFQLSNQSLVTQKTIKEVIFGYKDPFLSMLQFLDEKLAPSEYFHILLAQNNSVEGVYSIHTGLDDFNMIGKVDSFNHHSTLDYWTSDFANMINGTDGSVFRPMLSKNEPIYVFQSEYCRSLEATYNHTMKFKDIDVYAYELDEYSFANEHINSLNKGFCTPADNCLPSGLLNLTTCSHGKPVILSNPHFLYADKQFVEAIHGIQPNETKHNTMIYIEPLTGIPMKGNKRYQLNTQLSKDSRINLTLSLPEILFPLFWMDETFELDKQEAKKFYDKVNLPIQLVNYGKYSLLAIGSLLLTLSIVYSILVYMNYRRIKRNNELKNQSSLFNSSLNSSYSYQNERTPLIFNNTI